MIVVPAKTKIYIFKLFYLDFLLPITSMFLIILLCQSIPVKPKSRKWLYFTSVSMPLPNACPQK